MADNLVYEESLNTEIDQSEFISKKWVYVNDNNSQNYTSQVVIDSTPLSNAGGWINWQEGFIVMPLVVQLTSQVAGNLPLNGSEGDYAWAFKSGFWQMINSMTVEFNNQNVIQQTPFLNVFRSFKANTSFSQDDLFNVGPSVGFYPDNAKSWTYIDNFSVNSYYDGNGENIPYTNNSNFEFYSVSPSGTTRIGNNTNALNLPWSGVAGSPLFSPTVPASVNNVIVYNGQGSLVYSTPLNPKNINEGMLKRQNWYNYNPWTLATSRAQNSVNNATSGNAIYRSQLDNTQCTTDGSYVWETYAKLRLKDLADFFEKMPLLKGSTIRFYINTNQAITNFTVVNGLMNIVTGVPATYPTLTVNSVNVIGGLTNPLMLTSVGYGQGGSTLADGTYSISVSIQKNNFAIYNGVAGRSQLNSCRLYAPVYTMNPLAESKYLSLAPTKKVMYKDVFQYQFNNVGTTFNILVTNGIANICSVLVVPQISKNQTFTSSTTVGALPSYSSPLNPCCPSPAMPDPIAFTNFNILVSGVNLFLNNENYDFEAFLEQLAQSNQLNGGLTTGLASGLVNEDMFSSGYRYYYGDCSRILPSERGVSRSIQVVGQNSSLIGCDLMIFVEFMREITIDIATGARIE
jgi:hypothetical protein